MKIKLKTLIGSMGCLALALSLVGCASPQLSCSSVPSNIKIKNAVIRQQSFGERPEVRSSWIRMGFYHSNKMLPILQKELTKRGIQTEVRNVPHEVCLPGRYMIDWSAFEYKGRHTGFSINLQKNDAYVAAITGNWNSVLSNLEMEKAISVMLDQLLTGHSELEKAVKPYTADMKMPVSQSVKEAIVLVKQAEEILTPQHSTYQPDNSAAYAAIITNAANAAVAASRPRQQTIIVQQPPAPNPKNQVTYEQIRRQNDLRQLDRTVNKLRGIPY